MNLVIGGCSFSSAFELQPEQAYPYLISKQLGIGLIDQARIQGSNFRIWRTITKMIIDGKIIPTDKIIIQYTEMHRKEYWVPQQVTHEDSKVDEPFDNGKLFRFKYGADQYAHGIEKPIYKIMMRVANDNFDKELFDTNHFMFTEMLKGRGFESVVFVQTRYCNFTADYPVVDCDDILEAQNLDGWHLSPEGHASVAQRLCEFFKS